METFTIILNSPSSCSRAERRGIHEHVRRLFTTEGFATRKLAEKEAKKIREYVPVSTHVIGFMNQEVI